MRTPLSPQRGSGGGDGMAFRNEDSNGETSLAAAPGPRAGEESPLSWKVTVQRQGAAGP